MLGKEPVREIYVRGYPAYPVSLIWVSRGNPLSGTSLWAMRIVRDICTDVTKEGLLIFVRGSNRGALILLIGGH